MAPFRSRAFLAADAWAAGLLLLLVAPAALLAAGLARFRASVPRSRRMLAIDTAYSLHTIRSRKLEHFVTAGTLEGFFDRIWNVHPCVGASPDDPQKYGPVCITELDAASTMVEGHYGRFRTLRRLPLLNFLLSHLELLPRLQGLIRSEAVGLVRAHDPYYLGLLALPLAWANRLPFAILVSGNYDLMYRQHGLLAYPRLLRWRRVEQVIARLSLSRADLVSAVNEDNGRFAIDNGAHPSSVAIIRYGTTIDPVHRGGPERRTNRLAELRLGDGPVLLYVGRYEPVKLPQDVVRCLAVMRQSRSDVTALLVGDGGMRADLEALAADLGVSDAVVLAGNRDQVWLADVLASVDIVLAPLAGRALVEAALAARPIVAYDIEWHAELIHDGETGRLVAHRDWQGMAVAALDLLEDPEKAHRLGKNARELALRQHDPDAIR
ncbi:MAG: glycosyltransferase family 4 protein, partial [Chloroflexi bacterium]|nr:glycosyltransferase family 4 protein [Chloroflexota bacterium]